MSEDNGCTDRIMNSLEIYPVKFDKKGNVLGAMLPIGEVPENYQIRVPTSAEAEKFRKIFGLSMDSRRIAVRKNHCPDDWND